MAENETIATENKPKIAGFGKAIKSELIIPSDIILGEAPIETVGDKSPETVEAIEDKKVEAKKETVTPEDTKIEAVLEDKKSEITDELRKQFLKDTFGDSDIDVDSIKDFLKKPEDKAAEQKQQSIKELAILKLVVDSGSTTDQYNEIKRIATEDVKELSKKDFLADLAKNGFSEDDAEDFLKTSFFQVDLEELEQDFDNETTEEFEARKANLAKRKEYGEKLLSQYSSNKQTKAIGLIEQLAAQVEQLELQEKEEAAISSNVDDLLKNYSRKQIIELGKANDLEISPIEHEYSESSFKAVADILKDQSKRNNIFKKDDGTFDLPKLTEMLLTNFEYKRAVKNALLEGQHRSTAIHNSVFPFKNPLDIGIGGNRSKSNKGIVAGVGKTERVRPQYN